MRGESARPVCVVTNFDDIRESPKGPGKPWHSRLLECRWDKSGQRRQTLLFFDGFDDDKECDQVLIFHRMGCGKEPPLPSKYLPMGHIGRCQTRLRHLHRTHGHGGVSFRIFYMMLPDEKEATFVRAFDVIKRFTNSFTETSVAHVGCQPATIIALS